MKKVKKSKNLKIQRETVRSLADGTLGAAAGGAYTTPQWTRYGSFCFCD